LEKETLQKTNDANTFNTLHTALIAFGVIALLIVVLFVIRKRRK
jgi:hypothetical protein